MDKKSNNDEIQLVGGPCGQHGSYTFYKAFKYVKNGTKRIVTLSEFFFVKLWIDSDLLCIGELQLLWIDKNSDQILASLRLYFLPENTPDGRSHHGEDEVLAISEKVVIKVEDLVSWIIVDAEWTWGRPTICHTDVKPPEPTLPSCSSSNNANNNNDDRTNFNDIMSSSLVENSLDFSDVEKERRLLETESNNSNQNENKTNDKTAPTVIILSYPKYCRYRAMMKRLENVECDFLKYKIINTLGAFPTMYKNTRILFCRDAFEYPELEGHELLCNHLAPKLKGRPRGRRKKRSVSPGSESNESESSIAGIYQKQLNKQMQITQGGRMRLRCNKVAPSRRSARTVETTESKEFLKKLTNFMKANRTPIGRIPSLGQRELDLYSFYTKVKKLGGYDAVCSNRLWKSIFDDLSGHQLSTSAATIIRRHYERFLLAYERHVKGQIYKPPERRLYRKSKCSESGSELGEGTSKMAIIHSDKKSSGEGSHSDDSSSSDKRPLKSNANPANEKSEPQVQNQNGVEMTKSATTNNNSNTSPPNKTSTLRSIRVKPDRKLMPSTENHKENNSPEDILMKCEVEIKEFNDEDQQMVIKAEDGTANNKPSIEIFPETKIIEIVNNNNGSIKREHFKKEYLNEYHNNLKREHLAENKTKEPELYVHKVVKRRKLEILKEGGLEVTPVTSAGTTTTIRPSVIQQNIQGDHNHFSNKDYNLPESLNIVKVANKPTSIAKSNGTVVVVPPKPPRVVQSKSIYSYNSEKTIYGNPKDILPINGTLSTVTPKFSTGTKISGGAGDLLDLSVTSPQKPVVEIMRVPMASPGSTKTNAGSTRFGSNLEITLVTPPGGSSSSTSSSTNSTSSNVNNYKPNKSVKNLHSTNMPFPPNNYSLNSRNATPTLNNANVSANNYRASKPRHNSESTAYKPYKSHKSGNTTSDHRRHSISATNGTKEDKLLNAKLTYLQSIPLMAPPPIYPNGGVTAPNQKVYLPLMESALYSAALHNLYSNALGSPSAATAQQQQQLVPPPMPPIGTGLQPPPQMLTPEQFKIYSDLLAASHMFPHFQPTIDGAKK